MKKIAKFFFYVFLINFIFFIGTNSVLAIGTNLKVSSDGRWVADRATGQPKFFMADSAWVIHKLSPADQNTYFSNRKDKKFNLFYMTLAATWAGANYNGNTPFTTTNDCLSWNSSYFQYIKDLIAKADSYGFYVLLEIGEPVSPNATFFVGANNTSKAKQWGEKVGAYFKNNENVIYTLGEDMDAGLAGVSMHRAVAEGIVKGVTGNTVAYNQNSSYWDDVFITYHPDGSDLMCSSDWFHNEPWLDFNSVQLHSVTLIDDIYSRVNQDYNLTSVKPTWLIEGPYENWEISLPEGDSKVSDYWIRYEAYNAVFAGSFAGTYGYQPLYMFSSGWAGYLDSAGASDMQHLYNLIVNDGSRPFSELAPCQSAITSIKGTGLELRSALCSKNGNFLYVYLPRGGDVTVDMSKISKSIVKAQLYNPREGNYINFVNSGDYTNIGNRTFMAPGSGKGNDYILMLNGISNTIPTITGWTACAVEDEQCTFAGSKEVQYGAGGQYYKGTYTNGVLCANSVFGDPLVGAEKYCYYRDITNIAPASPTGVTVR